MSPASYFTGMEICTKLSWRVDINSSLSLWEIKNKITTSVRFQYTDTAQNPYKANLLKLDVEDETVILSPGSRHVDLNHLLNKLRTDLKYDSESFL